jgi:hypothetical protein
MGEAFEEISPPDCKLIPPFILSPAEHSIGLFKGSIFVSEAARNYLKSGVSISLHDLVLTQIPAKLRGSKFADEIDHITECFDKTTKIRVRGTDEWSFIKFGRPKDKDVQFNINGGQLKLPGCASDLDSFAV